MSRELTHVTLTYIPDRINVWLRFGRPVDVHNIDRHRRVALFAPGELFGRVCWCANEYGTTDWTFMVLRAAAQNQSMLRLRGIEPGAELLLRATAPAKVRHVLQLVDAIEAHTVDPAHASPHYWRVVNGRLAVNADVPIYSKATHDAYLAGEALR